MLDLFAGSGQLGLEALSRGAAYAVFADTSPEACRAIRSNIAKTHQESRSRLIAEDYKTVIRMLRGGEPFDLVFLDPPYASGLVDKALQQLLHANLLAEGAYVICEGDSKTPYSAENLTLYRFANYGKNVITILKKAETEA